MQIRKSLTPVFAAASLVLTAACQPAAQEGGMEEAAIVDTAVVMATFDSMRVAFETGRCPGALRLGLSVGARRHLKGGRDAGCDRGR